MICNKELRTEMSIILSTVQKEVCLSGIDRDKLLTLKRALFIAIFSGCRLCIVPGNDVIDLVYRWVWGYLHKRRQELINNQSLYLKIMTLISRYSEVARKTEIQRNDTEAEERVVSAISSMCKVDDEFSRDMLTYIHNLFEMLVLEDIWLSYPNDDLDRHCPHWARMALEHLEADIVYDISLCEEIMDLINVYQGCVNLAGKPVFFILIESF